MVSLTGQKRLHLRWSRLFLVSFAALAQSDRLLPNRRLRQMAKSTLPTSSPTSFTVSSVPFRALFHSRWCVCQVAHHGLLSLCSMWLCRLPSTVSWRDSPLSTVSSWLPGRKWAVHVCLSWALGSRFCCMGLCACFWRSEEHTSELQSRQYLVCRLLLEKKYKSPKWSPFTTFIPQVWKLMISA